MTKRDKDKIQVLFSEAKAWVDSNEDVTYGLDDDGEEVNVHCLTTEDVKRLLDDLKSKLLKEAVPETTPRRPSRRASRKRPDKPL